MSDIAKVVLGISFIFVMTSLGALTSFLFKDKVSVKFNKLIVGFSSGVMIAASIWSLLLPAIDGASNYGSLKFLPAVLGFFVGGLFLALIDFICKKLNHCGMKKSSKLFLAMTLHNIPEGIAVGVAFGSAWATGDASAMALALSLAIGMGVQNFPEGMAIALPMKQATGSKTKGFFMGVLSGLVEPIGAIIGFFLAASITVIMPWALSFAAGAMIYVVVSELFPESQVGEGASLGTWGTMLGFMLMMALDVGLG